MTDIRLVAPALNRDDVVALGEFETTIHLYALGPPRAVTSMSTVLSYGGHRLALCTPGDSLVIVAAAWERHGVCGYDARSGEQLWQRKDLKRAGPLSPAGDGSRVAVALDSRALQVLDAATGASVARVRKAQNFWQSRHGALAAVGWYRELALLDTRGWARYWNAPIEGFGVLDVAFALDGLIVSDSADLDEGGVGHVYAFGLGGEEQWRHPLPDEMLCWSLAWDDKSDEWVGLAHHVNRSTQDLLLRWARNGRPLPAIPLTPVTAAAFVPGGRTLITERHVVDTRTGTAFPLPQPKNGG